MAELEPNSTALHASANPRSASLTVYERAAAASGFAGLACCIVGAWMIWNPLAPLVLGTALLYIARLAAKCTVGQSGERVSRSPVRRVA